MRFCGKCGEHKGFEDFHKGSSRCKPCKNEISRKWNQDNPDRHRQNCRGIHRRKQRLALYGLSAQDYEAMLADQDGLCAICAKPPEGKRRLGVDHDHETGAVRGLLCGRCNSGIGFLWDSPHHLRAAISYLERARVDTGGAGYSAT